MVFLGRGEPALSMEREVIRMVSLQTLCARLRLLLDTFEHEGALGGKCKWSGVANLLFPAACIGRVQTDASTADLYDAGLYCGQAADFDQQQSEILDDYLSALVRFRFVWNAYETVRDNSQAGRLMKSRNPANRETLASRVPRAHLEIIDRVYGSCRSITQDVHKIWEWMGRKPAESVGLGKAGLLVKGFRDYLFHGHEEPPSPYDQDDQFRMALDGEEAISLHSYRLIAFTRLTLHLMQALVHAELRPSYEIETADVPFLSKELEAEFLLPCNFLLILATHWPEGRGSALSPKEIVELAADCHVGTESMGWILGAVGRAA